MTHGRGCEEAAEAKSNAVRPAEECVARMEALGRQCVRVVSVERGLMTVQRSGLHYQRVQPSVWGIRSHHMLARTHASLQMTRCAEGCHQA